MQNVLFRVYSFVRAAATDKQHSIGLVGVGQFAWPPLYIAASDNLNQCRRATLKR